MDQNVENFWGFFFDMEDEKFVILKISQWVGVILVHELLGLCWVLRESDQLGKHIIVRNGRVRPHLPSHFGKVVKLKSLIILLVEEYFYHGFAVTRLIYIPHELFNFPFVQSCHFQWLKQRDQVYVDHVSPEIRPKEILLQLFLYFL